MAAMPPVNPRRYLEGRIEHIGLVRRITHRRKSMRRLYRLDGSMTYEDIVQDALLQCVLKHETYDPAKGKLSTHYGYQIMGVLTARKKRLRVEGKYLRRLTDEDLEWMAAPEMLHHEEIDYEKVDFLLAQANFFDPVWRLLTQILIHQDLPILRIAQNIGVCRRRLGATQTELMAIFRTLWDQYPKIRFPNVRTMNCETCVRVAGNISKKMKIAKKEASGVRFFLLYTQGNLPTPNGNEIIRIRDHVKKFVTDETYRKHFLKFLAQEKITHE